MDLPFFISRRPYYSGLQFDGCRNNEIGYMYWFDIWNNFINSNSLVTLRDCRKRSGQLLCKKTNKYSKKLLTYPHVMLVITQLDKQKKMAHQARG
jgi:retron-type reverse transcriptase